MARYSDTEPKPNVKKNIFGKPKKTYSYGMDEGGKSIVRYVTKPVKKISEDKWAYETTTAPKQKPGKTRYANPQRGVKVGGLKSIFGGGRSSSASSAKPNKSYSSNPARAAKQKAREKGREKVCGPNGCTTRKRIEKLRDR